MQQRIRIRLKSYDHATLDQSAGQIVATVRPKNYGFRELIHEVTQSRVFLNMVWILNLKVMRRRVARNLQNRK